MTCSDNITLTDNVLIEQCKYDPPCDLLDNVEDGRARHSTPLGLIVVIVARVFRIVDHLLDPFVDLYPGVSQAPSPRTVVLTVNTIAWPGATRRTRGVIPL